MRARSLAASSCLVTALAFTVAACGSDSSSSGGSKSSGSSGSTSLTIYSSLPLQGDSRPQSESVVNGEKLALQEAGGKVGKYTIKYVSTDDATAAAGKWDPGQVSANARKAAQDKSTIVYLGEFNSGATAISLPILNEAGHPADLAVEHLRGPDPRQGCRQGRARQVLPLGQAHLRARRAGGPHPGSRAGDLPEDEGCTKTYILNDKEVYGKGIATQVADGAKAWACRSSATTASTRRPRTSAPWPRRSRPPAPTACSSAASPEQGRPGVQGRQRRQPEDEDVRA